MEKENKRKGPENPVSSELKMPNNKLPAVTGTTGSSLKHTPLFPDTFHVMAETMFTKH